MSNFSKADAQIPALGDGCRPTIDPRPPQSLAWRALCPPTCVRRCVATLHDKLQLGGVEHLNILLYNFEKLLITSQVTTGPSETPESRPASLRYITASDFPPTANT